MHIHDEEQYRDSIACALLRGYGAPSSREEAAHDELIQLRRLRALQNLQLCRDDDFPGRVDTDLTAYYKELLTAAELCLAGTGCRVQCVSSALSSGISRINRRAVAGAAMNLLSNGLIYSIDKTARVSWSTVGGNMLLRIDNNGAFDWGAVDVNRKENGRGLRAVQCVAQAHGGRLWLIERRGVCGAALILPIGCADAASGQKPHPSVEDLLFDRVSPVHVGLSMPDG
ncbi:MAG: hypothetical protein LBJ12_07965 [Oscillospiraceae bacterium]|nr:hypothetical protein [Oscillospiraceae bacterium]